MSGENLFQPADERGNSQQQGKPSLQNLNDAAEGTVVTQSPATSVTDAVQKNRFFGDSGDKSPESLKAEASGSDGHHALSNETPGKQDAIRDQEAKAATGEITDRELRAHLGIIEQKHQEFSSIADSTKTAAPAPKLAIERFVEPGGPAVIAGLAKEEPRSHSTSQSFIMNDDNKAEYNKLPKEVEDARGNRQLGDIPLSDAYWGKQNAITLFLSNLRT